MLGKLSVPERPTNLDNSRDKGLLGLYQVQVRVVWTCFLSSIFFLSIWDTARYRLKYCVKGPLNSN